ncbi:Leukotoxin export protein LtxD [anaerobic digester metagenome]
MLNKDIGFIKQGQKVDIKLDTFPFQKYGVVPGEIIHISPDAIQDEKLGYVYKIKVKPLQNTLKVEKKDMPLNPGMTAQAEVKTGKRHIIEFFLPGIEEVKDGFEVR